LVVTVDTVAVGDDRGIDDDGTAERSVNGQPMGCYWLLKLTPFCSAFHLTIIAFAATIDDASVVPVGDCDDGDDRGADGDDAVNVRQ